MKKLIFSLLATALIAFTGCVKYDDIWVNPLTGTTWEEVDETLVKTMSFMTDTDCKYTLRSDVIDRQEVLSYTYTYIEPKVYIKALEDGSADLLGEINGDTMTIINLSKDVTVGVFTKK